MSEIETLCRKAIGEKVFPGCVIGIVRANGERRILPFGGMIYHTGGGERTVKEDTIYDIASLTKSIPLASLALLLINEGKFKLQDSVRTYLPELQNDYGATIEDLLRYRVQGLQMAALAEKPAEEIMKYVFEQGFKSPPGESKYTNLPAFLLGLILEYVSGTSLNVQAEERFFKPLHMSHTTFAPISGFTKSRCVAATEIDGQEEIRGIPHDESARVFARVGKAVGHAGLLSTVPDLLNFLEALLSGDFAAVLSGAERGLGWQLNDQNFMGQYVGAKTFGKTGFTGCSIVYDQGRGIAFVILSNRTYPKRPPNTDAINAFRRDIADVVLQNT